MHGRDGKGDGRPVIAVSLGDPLGIGPEIILKALSDARLQAGARYRVFGSRMALEAAAGVTGISMRMLGDVGVEIVDDGAFDAGVLKTTRPGPTAAGGAASFRWVEQAIEDAKHGAAAIVTAPISKTSWMLAGHTDFPGHTELLAARFGAKRSGMLFVGPHLRVMLVTIHVPLMSVAGFITEGRVLEAIELAHEACLRLPGAVALSHGLSPRAATSRGTGGPRIAVCGLNPHAGEGGILGSEDDRVIVPAVAAARAKGMDVHGPLPADTVFRAAAAAPFGAGGYDCVVAMYHDQGLIPIKLIDGERAVNVTVGLPTIRTSPAHGTAFDIAGKGVASATSMVESIELAIRMAGGRA
jgi:4-hydroxythreonine-4-phosphate dehydrogenase